MRIALDAISLTSPQSGGYKTYVTNLVHNLLELQSHEIVVMVDRAIDLKRKPQHRVEILARRGSLGFIWREQVAIPNFARPQDFDLIHFPCATGALRSSIPSIVTVYDTIELTERLPSPRHAKLWSMRLYSRFVQQAVAVRAERVITISSYSRQAIASRLRLDPTRICVTYLAASSHFRPVDRALATTYVLSRYGVSDYVLGIASMAPRKNIIGLLRAYVALPEQLRARHPLLLVCTHQEIRNKIEAQCASLGMDQQVVLAEAVTDIDLLYLYNAASLFAFPSLEEGFGLPPLEAMACGTPVIASDSSSLPEVLGDAALLIPPGDTQALADALAVLLTDARRAEELVEFGIVNAGRFSWRKTAEQTLAAYEAAVGVTSHHGEYREHSDC